MGKNAYYFPHDTNASEDEKIVHLLSVLDWTGYGLYWTIIEKLHASSDGWLDADYERIAFALRTQCVFIKQILNDFKLFRIHNGRFTSDRVQRNLKHQKDNSLKARKSVKSRWNKVVIKDTDVIRPLYEGNTIKESKVKESKVKEIGSRAFAPPTQEEVTAYCKERKNTVDYLRFFDFYTSKGWMVGKNKMKDWKAAVRNWERDSPPTTVSKHSPEDQARLDYLNKVAKEQKRGH